ncbi:unnamed protein product [Callosobruchus maculatus]|uniref:Regulatory protein zeste n=1 Tax=Callosobruchus maculatus TaxID=64391 RepID=A0A653C684_CALMS|nr:unnamed protein product [Callosobruchus maculatus]
MSSNKAKRARGSNFTKEEELLLVRTVAKFGNIIECKVTDKINNKEKHETWQKIMLCVNANNSCLRTVEQLRVKYENLKSKARKVMAQHRLVIPGTGGGPENIELLDPVLKAVLEIINKNTVAKSYSPVGSDSLTTQYVMQPPKYEIPFSDEEGPTLSSPSEQYVMQDPKDEIVFSDEEITTLSHPSEDISKEVLDDYMTSNDKTQLIKSYMATDSEPEVHDNTSKQDQNIDVDSLTSKKCSSKRKRHELKEDRNNAEQPTASKIWESYTSRKHRSCMSKKRKAFISSLKKAYYENKILFAKEEIKRSKLEQEAIIEKIQRDNERNSRERETHRKRMELLYLEIEMKKRMLK